MSISILFLLFSENDWAELQTDLRRLVEWSEKSQLQFSADKCKVLHLGRNNRRVVYNMEDTEL